MLRNMLQINIFSTRASTDNSELFIYNPLARGDVKFYFIFWELNVVT